MNIPNSDKSYNLTITGLSPIHIGSGKKYSQLDYIAREGNIHILDFERILTQIPIEVIDDLTKDILENFKNNIWNGDVEEFLNKYGINWREFIEKNYELIGKIGKNEINQFIKTGDQIYIPGSSVKGAIRTAILFNILENYPSEKEKVIRSVLFGYSDREIMNLIRSDAKTDLLRALMVSDLTLTMQDRSIKIAKSNVYHLRTQDKIPIFEEILYSGFICEGTIKINQKLVDSNKLISQYFYLRKEEIIRGINSFSKKILEYELKQFKNQSDSNLEGIIKYYESLKKQLGTLNENECILRLGQGSSLLGITLFLNFKHYKYLFERFRGLEIIRFNKDDLRNPGYAFAKKGKDIFYIDRNSEHKAKLNEQWLCIVPPTRRNVKYALLIEKITSSIDIKIEKDKIILFPLTRKFLLSKDEDLLFPFGWVKLEWE